MAQRVFVIWTHPIFRDSVRLLLQHPDVVWVGDTSDHAAASEQISSLQPDTVVVEGADRGILAEVMGILDVSPSHLRIVDLRLADNNLVVYHREQQVAGQADDLLRLILSESS